MSNATDVLEELAGDHQLRTATWAKPLGIWVGLITAVVDAEAGDVVEVSGGNYGRVQVGPSDAAWNGPTYGNKTFSNADVVTFPAPSADWAASPTQITHFGLWDSEEDGTLLVVAELDAPRDVLGTDPSPTFAAGDLEVVFSGQLTDDFVDLYGGHLLRDFEWDKPTLLYFGLEVMGTEVTGGSYARVARNPSDANWNGPTYGSGEYTNTGAIVWSAPSADWGDVDSVSAYDAASGGNKLFTRALSPAVEILNGALAPNLAAGAVTFTFA